MITLSWIDLAFLVAFSACIGGVFFGLIALYRQVHDLATGEVIRIAAQIQRQSQKQ